MPVPLVAEVLRLVGRGAGGQILMALGKGALRTGKLTEQISQFSSRSVYRYSATLEASELIDRFEEAGVPSTVILSLSDRSGRGLFRLLQHFAATPSAKLPTAGRDFESWASLTVLGEMWEFGFLDHLSYGARSLTELSQAVPEMTFHQVNRRIDQFIGAELVGRLPGAYRKEYELTDQGRRRMALVASIGRWRHRHAGAAGAAGLTITEMVTVLRAALPLTSFPQHVGMTIALGVAGTMDDGGHRETGGLKGRVGFDGTMRYEEQSGKAADGSAAATVSTWFAALLDGNRGRMQVRGDLKLIDSFLIQLYDVLWGEPGIAPVL